MQTLPEISLDIAQRIIDGHWKHAVESRRSCAEGDWRAFQEKVLPSPGKPRWYSFGSKSRYLSYTRCIERAVEMVDGPRTVSLQLIPTWSGDNEIENPRDDCWFETHVIKVGDGKPAELEIGPVYKDADPSLSRHVLCEAKVWDVGVIVESMNFAPDIELELRDGDYGVLRSDVIEVLSVDVSADLDPAPKPTIEVPPFCCWTEPRVLGLAKELEDDIRGLSITVDDEGNIVERPGH